MLRFVRKSEITPAEFVDRFGVNFPFVQVRIRWIHRTAKSPGYWAIETLGKKGWFEEGFLTKCTICGKVFLDIPGGPDDTEELEACPRCGSSFQP